MARQESTPLKTASRNLLVAAIVILIGIGAAAAFGVGFSSALEQGLSNPASAPALRVAAAERLRDVLGYDGFLKSYREGAEASVIAARVREANTAIRAFMSASETEADAADAKAMAAYVAVFERAVRDRMSGTPSPDPSALERTYVALKSNIADAITRANLRRIETLGHAFSIAQTLAVLALIALSLTLFGLAWYIRTRLLGPLRALRLSAEKAADGGLFRHLWGIERGDEIGALARAANRLRRQLAFEAHEAASPAGEIRSVLENRPYHAALAAPGQSPEVTAIANRLEAGLASIVAVVGEAKSQIESASRDAALASKTAVEAAKLARTGAEQMTERAERVIADAGDNAQSLIEALAASVSRLNQAASRLDHASVAIVPIREPTPAIGREARPSLSYDPGPSLGRITPSPAGRGTIGDSLRPLLPSRYEPGESHPGFNGVSYRDREREKEKVEADLYAALARLAESKQAIERNTAEPLAELSADLDALESLARSGTLGKDEAQAVTVSLIEAIERLNGVVERVASTVDKKPLRNQY